MDKNSIIAYLKDQANKADKFAESYKEIIQGEHLVRYWSGYRDALLDAIKDLEGVG